MLRQLVYRDGIPLLPPAMDPEGWHIAGPVTVSGRLHDVQDASAKLTVSDLSAYQPPISFYCM